ILNVPLTYTPARGSDQLRQALATAYELNPEHVQVTTGASEALHIIFFNEAAPGTNVVVPEPGYTPFSSLPEAFGVEVRTYRLQRERDWSIDAAEIERLIDNNTRIVVLNSPHNPTGAIIHGAELKRLHDYT